MAYNLLHEIQSSLFWITFISKGVYFRLNDTSKNSPCCLGTLGAVVQIYRLISLVKNMKEILLLRTSGAFEAYSKVAHIVAGKLLFVCLDKSSSIDLTGELLQVKESMVAFLIVHQLWDLTHNKKYKCGRLLN